MKIVTIIAICLIAINLQAQGDIYAKYRHEEDSITNVYMKQLGFESFGHMLDTLKKQDIETKKRIKANVQQDQLLWFEHRNYYCPYYVPQPLQYVPQTIIPAEPIEVEIKHDWPAWWIYEKF